MKIAFIGTSCVGKTTLLAHYREAFTNDPQVICVAEAARDFYATHATPDRFSANTQGYLQHLALQCEQEAHATGASLLFCDRSVLDAVVYVRAHGDRQGASALLKQIQTWLPTYSKLLLLDPADVAYATDGIRQEAQQTRQRFHEAFLAFFEETALPYELLTGPLHQRCCRIDELIEPFRQGREERNGWNKPG